MTSNILPLIKGSLFKNKLRTFLTIFSIILGVSAIVSLQIAIDSTKKEYIKFVNENVSNADLIVESTSSSPVEIDLDKIKSNINVKDFSPQLKINGITKKDKDEIWLTLFGVNINKEISSKGLVVADGQLPKSNEMLLIKKYADMRGISLGDNFDINTEKGVIKFKVSGFLDSKGIIRQNASNNYMMTCVINLSDARQIYGANGLTSVNVSLKESTDAINEKDKIKDALGGNVIVKLPEEKSEDLINKINGLFIGLNIFGFLALFIGCFLIYNTMSSIVLNSNKEIAVLKVIGGDKKYIFSWVFQLSFIYGCIGSILGFIGGIGLSKLVIKLIEASGVGVKISSFSIPWANIILMSLLGLIISVISSIFPAIKATRITVIEGLSIKKLKSSYSLKKIVYALIISLILLSAMTVLRNINSNIKYILFFVALIIIYLVLLLLIKPLARGFTSFIKKIFPLGGNMINSNISNNIYRTTNTIFSLILCVAMSVGFMGGIKSFKMSMVDWYYSLYKGEIAINNPMGFTEKSFNQIKNTSGVKEICPFYVNSLKVFDSTVMAEGLDPDVSNIKFTGSSQSNVTKNFKEKDTIVLSTILRKKLNVNIDDTVDFPSDKGLVRLKVVGFINTSRNNGNEVYLFTNNFKSLYPNIASKEVCVQIDKSIGTSKVIENLKGNIKNEYVSYVDMSEFINYYEKSLNDMFTIFYVIMALGFIICILVIMNSMVINTNEMKYQISLLKSFGLLKKQMVSITSSVGAVYGIISAVFGSLLGIFINFCLIYFIESIMGIGLTFMPDLKSIIVVSLISIIVSIIASVLTALYAYRVKVTNVLRTGET